MKHHSSLTVGALVLTVAGASFAQQTPRARTTVVPATEPAQITVSLRGADAQPFATVKATNSDVRATLNEMAQKAGVKVLLAPSTTGVITGAVDNQSIDAAFAAVGAMANLTVRKIMLPEAGAGALTPETAGRYAEALAALPVGAVVADAAGGKALAVTTTAPAPAAGMTTVYYVQGRLTPEQERIARERRANRPDGAVTPPGAAANPEFVSKTAQSLMGMPLQQRMETMRALQRQMFESMTPEEREQMRQNMPRRGFRGDNNDGGRRGQNGQQ